VTVGDTALKLDLLPNAKVTENSFILTRIKNKLTINETASLKDRHWLCLDCQTTALSDFLRLRAYIRGKPGSAAI